MGQYTTWDIVSNLNDKTKLPIVHLKCFSFLKTEIMDRSSTCGFGGSGSKSLKHWTIFYLKEIVPYVK